MINRANATFQTGNWDESSFSEIEGGPKLTRALVAGTYSGDIAGDDHLVHHVLSRQRLGEFQWPGARGGANRRACWQLRAAP
jgi:hypothetical protein